MSSHTLANAIRGIYEEALAQGHRAQAEGIADAAIAVSGVIKGSFDFFDRAKFLVDCGLDPDCKAVAEAKKER